MSKTIIALVLSTLLASCVALWGWTEASTARGQVNDQIALRKAAEARTIKIQKSLRAVESKYAVSKTALEAALRSVPDRPTDRAVYDSLCARGNCASVGALPSPAD